MVYKWKYHTPQGLDDLWMNSDGKYLTGVWFDNSKDASKHIISCEEKEVPIFQETCRWLDCYFQGKNPDFTPNYKIDQLTPFRKEVIQIMMTIPFGKTVTYQDIAKIIAKKHHTKTMSAQAVGGAVGWNPLCLIIPCHRVVGKNGSLIGYGGGIYNKVALLKHEKNDMEMFFIPKKGTAL